MGGAATKPLASTAPVQLVQSSNNQAQATSSKRSLNTKVTMFWQRHFGNDDKAKWPDFLMHYRQWLSETFPDVLDDEELDKLLTEEAVKALKHCLCGKRGGKSTGIVTLETLSNMYPSGQDLFICSKQLVSRSVRQYTQDLRIAPGGHNPVCLIAKLIKTGEFLRL